MALDNRTEYRTDAEQTDEAFRRNVIQIADRMGDSYNRALDGIFNNPLGLTAQEAADSLGTDAKQMFQFLNSVKTTLETYTSRTLTPPSDYATVTLNADGTATIVLNPA